MIRKAHGFMGGAGEGAARGMDRLAVSADERWTYLVRDIKRRTRHQTREHHHDYLPTNAFRIITS